MQKEKQPLNTYSHRCFELGGRCMGTGGKMKQHNQVQVFRHGKNRAYTVSGPCFGLSRAVAAVSFLKELGSRKTLYVIAIS